jgi:hypothetical protein
MRIHTNLHRDSFQTAARTAGVDFERLTEHGSRSAARAFDVILTGHGVTGGQWGNSGTNGAAPYKTATWDEWGIFLNAIFQADPGARTRDYDSAEDFHTVTGGRFETLTPAEQHLRHRWTPDGNYGADCKCGAHVQWR